MPRLALASTPTIGYIEPGRDAYLHAIDLRKHVRSATQWWTFGDNPTTLRMPGSVYYKGTASFVDHRESDLAALLEEYESFGVPRPSGYADVFHQLFRSPRVPWSPNALLAGAFAGAWQHACHYGAARGTHYRYDLRSAYLWAGGLGLPDPDTYSFTRTIDGRDAVYRVKLRDVVPGAPHPFDSCLGVLATTAEIREYELPVESVIGGVYWTKTIDPSPMLDAIRKVSAWKQVGRMYWGRWASLQRVCCWTQEKSWPLPSFNVNFVWAHLIVSRVKRRVWEQAGRAVHVYVDSVITPHRIQTGPSIGDWRLEETYANGVAIKGPGWYGPLGAPLQKMAGIRRDSLARSEWRANIV